VQFPTILPANLTSKIGFLENVKKRTYTGSEPAWQIDSSGGGRWMQIRNPQTVKAELMEGVVWIPPQGSF
jgi:hypothetical protein